MRTATKGIDYTSKDYEAFRQDALDQLSIKMPEYTDRSQTDAGIVLLELFARGLDILSFYQDVYANEAFLSTETQRENALKWCSMLDYTPKSATPSKVKQVFTLPCAFNHSVYVPAGTVVKTAESPNEYPILFETMQDLEIPTGAIGDEKDANGNYLYTVDAVQGYSVLNEVVGSSTGVADQKFKLAYTPVISSTISVLVNEGQGYEPWTQVSSFIDSEPFDKHFMIETSDNDEVFIVFGNGVSGKIPLVYDNGIISTYRVGGGEQGNVGANTITQIDSSVSEVSGTFNPEEPYEKGVEKETLDQIKVNAPNSFRTKWACLSVKDYSDRLKELFPDVILASAKRGEKAGTIDNVYVYYVLKDKEAMPDDLKEKINTMFSERELVGTTAILVPPDATTFVPVTLNASVVLSPRYSQATVQSQIKAQLSDYFELGNMDFNEELSLTELESMILADVEGIRSIRLSSSSSISTEADTLVSPAINQVLTLGSVNFTFSGGIS